MSCILKLVIVQPATKAFTRPTTFKRFLVLTVRWFFPTKTESHISLSVHSDNRLSAYAVAERDVLLIFRKGTTEQTVSMPSGTIPGHGGDGALHLAFAIDKDELDRWEIRLAANGVTVEGRNDWARGGRSIYFRDPDGRLLELATPGLWSIY
jgi:catechol 2,3-dioxygenase-like lactoylglutathione lyase family enzyme